MNDSVEQIPVEGGRKWLAPAIVLLLALLAVGTILIWNPFNWGFLNQDRPVAAATASATAAERTAALARENARVVACLAENTQTDACTTLMRRKGYELCRTPQADGSVKVCWCRIIPAPARSVVVPPAPRGQEKAKPPVPVMREVRRVERVTRVTTTTTANIPHLPTQPVGLTTTNLVYQPLDVTTNVTFQPLLPPLNATEAERERFCSNRRLNAVFGAELELSSSWARSGYGAAGIYCMRRLRDGQEGFGIGAQGAIYGADPGTGEFRGNVWGVGPAYMRVWNSGQDLEVKLMGGGYNGRYSDGDYRQSENYSTLSLSVAHNDYSRRLRGETSMPERQIFGMVSLPIGGGCEAAWQGNDVGCSELNLYANAGARQWINNNVYIQAGVLGELRSGDDYFSCSVRVGVANDRRTIGAHAGINACNGGIQPAIGVWYDLGTDLRTKRTEQRLAAVTEDTGAGEPATDIVLTPLAATGDNTQADAESVQANIPVNDNVDTSNASANDNSAEIAQAADLTVSN